MSEQKVEYSQAELELQNIVCAELANDWISKSQIQWNCNIYNVSKVIYEILEDLNEDFCIIQRDMHGYAGYKRYEKYYEYTEYRLIEKDKLSEYGNVSVTTQDSLDYKPVKKSNYQRMGVPIDEELPSVDVAFGRKKEYDSSNNWGSSYDNSYAGYNKRYQEEHADDGYCELDEKELDKFAGHMIDAEDVLDEYNLTFC